MNRITKIGSVVINDNEVFKEEDDLSDLFAYLDSRDFSYYANINRREDNKNVYKFEKDNSINNYQKAEDLGKTLALLHNKTSFNKEVKLDTYSEIYDNILGYVNYIDEYYLNMLKKMEIVRFPAPYELLFMSNYTKLKDAIGFVKRELNNWHQIVNNSSKQRVALNHGNPSINHILISDKPRLISWNKHTIDSPIMDLIKLYHNEWNNTDFNVILDKYYSICDLKKEEKMLLYINISIPLLIEFDENAFNNTVNVRKLFDYLYKTENLIRPYYTVENKE